MIQSRTVILFVILYLIQCSAVSFASESCNCGSRLQPRIVGGTETGINEYIFMAGIYSLESYMIYCGATIISKQYLLTAAHCINNRDINKIAIVVGEHDVTTLKETNATKAYKLLNASIHPKYNANTSKNDIAIVSINGMISYSNKVGPACLPVSDEFPNITGQTVTLLGWGLLEFAGEESTTLQKVEVSVVSTATCQEYYSTADNTSLCTYTPGRDSCQMDSGGPVLWANPKTAALTLVGIIALGTGCASKYPSINVKVAEYISWIEVTTKGIGLCGA